MCTLALFFRASRDFPLIVAANRDEHYDRPTIAPGLPEGEPRVIAGKDLKAGGTWLGINEHGIMAGILNRRANGNVIDDPRSRGLLCLDLLRCANAAQAHDLVKSRSEAYQPFTVVWADAQSAWAACNRSDGIQTVPLKPGLHVFGNGSDLDEQQAKRKRAYALFAAAAANESFSRPAFSWVDCFKPVLSDHNAGASGGDPRDAICVHGAESGTVSASIIALSNTQRKFLSFYAAGAPCKAPFEALPVLSLR